MPLAELPLKSKKAKLVNLISILSQLKMSFFPPQRKMIIYVGMRAQVKLCSQNWHSMGC